jgi:hypothetical protein
MGEEKPTAICFIPCVAGATEDVIRKAAIGSLDADRRTADYFTARLLTPFQAGRHP